MSEFRINPTTTVTTPTAVAKATGNVGEDVPMVTEEPSEEARRLQLKAMLEQEISVMSIETFITDRLKPITTRPGFDPRNPTEGDYKTLAELFPAEGIDLGNGNRLRVDFDGINVVDFNITKTNKTK